MKPPRQQTVRQLIGELTDLAGHLAQGLDSPVVAGVCDGQQLLILDHLDPTSYRRVSGEDSSVTLEAAMILVHHGVPLTNVSPGLNGA